MNAAEENVIHLPTGDQPQQVTQMAPDATGLGNLEKVRDILFGSQMRDYDRRFVRLEERLLKEASDLRDETRRRFESLETFIRQEFSSLSDRLKSETQQRSEANETLAGELRDSARTINQKIHQLDEQTSQSNRELREQILGQSKDLSDEIRRKHEEISATLTREARELRTDKVDRSALSNMLTELAMRLNNEFKLPGEE